MPLIDWSQDLSVGIQSIDDQHKKLINMINALHDAMSQNQGDAVMGKIFEGLAGYTQKHFAYEEELFAKHGFPGSDAHKKEHEALISQVAELKKQFDYGQAVITMDLMQFLKGWLNDHIKGTDKKYTDFLLSKGVR